MNDRFIRPQRTAKGQMRTIFYCLCVAIVFTLPFGTGFMASRLGFSLAGRPAFILPKYAVAAMRLLAVVSFAFFWYFLLKIKYHLAGGALCVAGLFLWGWFRAVYWPWMIFRWTYAYWEMPASWPVIQQTLICAGAYLLVFTTGELLLFKRKKIFAGEALGSARLASGDQLVADTGLIVGRHRESGRLLRYNGNRHLMTIAPTRSGKGVGSLIPNILTYRRSMIVVDPKGENCDYTYERREQVNDHVYVLDPFGVSNYAQTRGANSFNPLDIVGYKDPTALEYCNDITDSIITKNPQGLKDFWMRAAQDMYAGFLYYISQAPEYNDEDQRPYKPHLRRITTVNDLLKLRQSDLMAYTKRISRSDRIPLQVKKVANDILSDSNSKKMLGSIIKTLQVNIEFMDSPFIRAASGESDFSLENLITGDATLYIILPPDKIRIYKKWLQMMIELIIKRTTQLRNPKNPNLEEQKILFLLDEFPNLGRMDYVKDSYSIMAGYGMQMWAFAQNIPQLKNTYQDDWQTFVSNSGILQAFGANDVETAKYLSRVLGETTRLSKSNAQQKAVSSIGVYKDSGTSRHFNEINRPLKTPDEIMTMDRGQQIIKKDGLDPIQADKVTYYEDSEFEGTFTTREQAHRAGCGHAAGAKPTGQQTAESDLMEIIKLTSKPTEASKPTGKENRKQASNNGATGDRKEAPGGASNREKPSRQEEHHRSFLG